MNEWQKLLLLIKIQIELLKSLRFVKKFIPFSEIDFRVSLIQQINY
jgi:hypothetical protein